jgi:hypothetical protein
MRSVLSALAMVAVVLVLAFPGESRAADGPRGQRVQFAPVFRQPVFRAPVFRAPVFRAPVFRAPIFRAPVFRARAPLFQFNIGPRVQFVPGLGFLPARQRLGIGFAPGVGFLPAPGCAY